MNVYDFDNTIYKGDSTVDFYLFCIKKNKRVLLYLPKTIIYSFLYVFRRVNKNRFKEVFFEFVSLFNDIDSLVETFWSQKINKITNWYKKQHKKTDVIVSASPEFLLKPLEKKLNIKKVIATKVDKKSGKLLDDNCYGNKKVDFFKKYYDINDINNFYTDSMSDLPMIKKAKSGYIVKNRKHKIEKYK